MNLFRSEEHVARALGNRPAGAVVPVAQLAALASEWWHDRLDSTWRPHTREENQAILDRVGLTGPFWRLA
jgi:hypothetical protein